MEWLKQYRIDINENGEYELIIYLDEMNTEFADEYGNIIKEKEQDLIEKVQSFIKEKVPDIKLKAVKIVLGGILLSTLPLAGLSAEAASTNYTVKSGDTLWKIAQEYKTSVAELQNLNNLSSTNIQPSQILKIPSLVQTYTVKSGDTLFKIANQYNTTVAQLRTLNNLTSDTINIGQVLRIAQTSTQQPVEAEAQTYTVRAGDTLFTIASRFNTTVAQIRTLNNLSSDTILVGQVLRLTPNQQQSQNLQTYTVKSGDTLWRIAQSFNISVDQLRNMNNLTSDVLQIGQTLRVPNNTDNHHFHIPEQTQPTVSYSSYTVKSGDNPWNIAINHRIPVQEVLTANNLTTNSRLTIGQTLRIPVHHIPVRPVVSSRHGEFLDWWTEAQYLFAVNDIARVIDFETGRSFQVKRTTGAFHADSEPLTAQDTEIAKSIWGGFSWRTRPVIIEVGGRRIAASMSYMPHDVQYIHNNNFNGHFDIHFLNSTRHVDNTQDVNHQAAIRVAAGVSQH